jgi:hypothetical protein
MKYALALTSVVLALLFLPIIVVANPIMTPVVDVDSPINNYVYPTGDVYLPYLPCYLAILLGKL